jgi:2-polyprenyl-3-methyl-5-hydroxy-6-metoxy-1,4-benzoquinol methylase
MRQDSLLQHLNLLLNSNRDWRRICIANLLLKYLKKGSLLDIGCGYGFFSKYFSEKGYDVLGIDVEDELISLSQKATASLLCKPLLRKCSINDIVNENKKFDNIIILDVLEHIQDDDILVKSAISLLKPGGILVISVPAYNILFSKRDAKLGHLRRYSRKRLNEIIPAEVDKKIIRPWNFIGLFVRILENIFDIDTDNFSRLGKDTTLKKILSFILKKWFFVFENNIRLPIGLTIISVIKNKRVNITGSC